MIRGESDPSGRRIGERIIVDSYAWIELLIGNEKVRGDYWRQHQPEELLRRAERKRTETSQDKGGWGLTEDERFRDLPETLWLN